MSGKFSNMKFGGIKHVLRNDIIYIAEDHNLNLLVSPSYTTLGISIKMDRKEILEFEETIPKIMKETIREISQKMELIVMIYPELNTMQFIGETSNKINQRILGGGVITDAEILMFDKFVASWLDDLAPKQFAFVKQTKNKKRNHKSRKIHNSQNHKNDNNNSSKSKSTKLEPVIGKES